MRIDINGEEYRIEFQHITKHHKTRRLGYFGDLKGVTTCVVIGPKAVSIGTVFCGDGDRFSKEEGRTRALQKALYHHPYTVGVDSVRKCFTQEVADKLMSAYEDRPRKTPKLVRKHKPRKWTAEEVAAARKAAKESEARYFGH